jgi:hypothetical protein
MLKAKAQTDDIILKLLNFKTMQTKKMSLANIQGKLSRNEMKNIMAGLSDGGDGGDDGGATACTQNSDCPSNGKKGCSCNTTLGRCQCVTVS